MSASHSPAGSLASSAPILSPYDDGGGADNDSAPAVSPYDDSGSGTMPSSGVPSTAASSLMLDHDDLPKAKAPRQLRWWSVCFLAFVMTCAGPAGIEVSVNAGGYFYSILGILLMPIIYVLPQIVVISELGSMMPTNAGYIVWVERAFGDAGGFFNAWISTICNCINAATYPIIVGDYLNYTFSGVSAKPSYTVLMSYRIGALVVGTFISLLSTKHISIFSAVASCMIIACVSIVFCAAAAHIPTAALGTQAHPLNLGLLGSSLLYLYAGWTALGSLAGETRTHRALLVGLSSALVLDCFVFLFSLLAAVAVVPPGHPWHVGFFVTTFNKIIPGMGIPFGLAVAIANIANFCSALVCYSRLFWGIAEMGWAPAKFRTQLDSGSPVYGVIFVSTCAGGLIWFHLGTIVQIMYTIIAVSYMFFYFAFLKLRYTEPYEYRPFSVPGGMPVAWLITLMKAAIMGSVCISGIFSAWYVAVAFFVANGAVGIGYVVFRRYNPLPPESGWTDEEEELADAFPPDTPTGGYGSLDDTRPLPRQITPIP